MRDGHAGVHMGDVVKEGPARGEDEVGAQSGEENLGEDFDGEGEEW